MYTLILVSRCDMMDMHTNKQHKQSNNEKVCTYTVLTYYFYIYIIAYITKIRRSTWFKLEGFSDHAKAVSRVSFLVRPGVWGPSRYLTGP